MYTILACISVAGLGARTHTRRRRSEKKRERAAWLNRDFSLLRVYIYASDKSAGVSLVYRGAINPESRIHRSCSAGGGGAPKRERERSGLIEKYRDCSRDQREKSDPRALMAGGWLNIPLLRENDAGSVAMVRQLRAARLGFGFP